MESAQTAPDRRAWRLVRRLGLRLEQVSVPEGVALRLVSDREDARVEARGPNHAAAVSRLAETMAELLTASPATPRPHLSEWNAARRAQTACSLGHPYTSGVRQRRCLVCAAARRAEYNERRRAARRAARRCRAVHF
jgi:hypothetical protein